MKRKAIIITIVVAVLILVAVASWLIYKKFFKKENTDTNADTTPPPIGTTSKPVGLNVKAFQIYANSKGYTPKLLEDNKWGPATAAAWNIYGNDFKNKPFVPYFAKGDKIIPRFPMLIAPAYDEIGIKIGDFKSAIVEQSNADTIYGFVMIPSGPYNALTKKNVKLQPKDWIKG
jgi:hypothetical protein